MVIPLVAEAGDDQLSNFLALNDAQQVPKRSRYFEESSQSSSGGLTMDPLFASNSAESIPEPLHKFIDSVFVNGLPRAARWTLMREYPRFEVTALRVPEADKDIMSILGRDFPTREDKNLRGVQSAIVSASIPSISLLADLVKQGFTGQPDELIPAQEVIRVTRQTLALLGNASSLTSFKRRAGVIAAVKPKRPKLANFLEEVCKEKVVEPSSELFGPAVKKRINERAATIRSFNESIDSLDYDSSRKNRFLGKGPSAKYGSGSDAHVPRKPYTPRR